MSSRSELIEAWQRLDLKHLEAIARIGRSPQLAAVSVRMQHYVANSLNSEADHREHYAVKADQTPDFDAWSDSDVADAYFAALMIERACGPSERLQEFAGLLRLVICAEMAARLLATDLAKEMHRG